MQNLAYYIGERHGNDVADKIFGDMPKCNHFSDGGGHEIIGPWFHKFVKGMDELNDKEFLQNWLIKYSSCGEYKHLNYLEVLGRFIKECYDKCKTLEEFVDIMQKDERVQRELPKCKLEKNILYCIRPKQSDKNRGACGKGCHCSLARHADEPISDIFCYCCVGHDVQPFQMAFGNDIKVELISSIVCGDKECVTAIHLPAK